MIKSKPPFIVSSLILILLWLRIGQILTTSVYNLDLIWYLGLWVFHWRRQTGRSLSLLSVVLLLPGIFNCYYLWFSMSGMILGLLQLSSQYDENVLGNWRSPNYW